jgi:hypothetical protein
MAVKRSRMTQEAPKTPGAIPDNPHLFRIASSFFCAGLEIRQNTVILAAPIIKYMIGWSKERVILYCTSKGWKLEVVSVS